MALNDLIAMGGTQNASPVQMYVAAKKQGVENDKNRLSMLATKQAMSINDQKMQMVQQEQQTKSMSALGDYLDTLPAEQRSQALQSSYSKFPSQGLPVPPQGMPPEEVMKKIRQAQFQVNGKPKGTFANAVTPEGKSVPAKIDPQGNMLDSSGNPQPTWMKGPDKPTGKQTGWTFMRSEDTKNAYRVNPNSGEVQRKTDNGWVADPEADITNMQKIGNQGGFGSSINKRFVNRVSGAGNEGVSALISITGMSNPNSGLFSSSAMGGAGGKSITAGILSSEGVKQYNATVAGLAPEIAAAQNQGLAPTDAQINSVEQAISIGPTDSLKTKQYKIAVAARFFRNSLEVSRDLASTEQKATIDKIMGKLEVFPDPNIILGNKWEQGVYGGQYQGPDSNTPADSSKPANSGQPPEKNAQGWTLHEDANGNKAYVSPDGKQFEAVK